MSRPPKPNPNKIRHATYAHAYLEKRVGYWYTRIHDKKKTTHILTLEGESESLQKQARKEAIEILNERVREYTKPKDSTKTLDEVKRIFFDFRSGRVGAKTLKFYKYIFEKYLPNGKTKISETESISDHIRLIVKESEGQLSQATIHSQLNKLRAFFDFCVKERYCQFNPVQPSMIPENPPSKILLFSDEETAAIITNLLSGAGAHLNSDSKKEVVYLIKFICLTGMRISECLKLRKSDISEKGITVDGKRSKHNVPKVRHIPFSSIEGLKELCDEILNLHTQEKFFTWDDAVAPRQIFGIAMMKLGIKIKGRSFHSFRKTTLNKWEKIIGIKPELRNLLAGHGFSVKNHYYTPPTIDDTIKKIKELE